MKTLREIKRRVESIKSTSKITQAMKIIAVSMLKKSEDKIKKSEEYKSEIGKFIYNVYNNEKYKFKIENILKKRKGRELLIIIGTDKGLCGDFINKIINKINLLKIEKESEILLIGKKIITKNKLGCIKKMPFLEKKFKKNMFLQSLEIASKILSNKSIEKCRVIYTNFTQ